MSYFTHLQCAESGERFTGDEPRLNTCPSGDILEARYDLKRLSREIGKDDMVRGPSSLWRYAPMLPVASPEKAVSLSEGWTPLLRLPALGRLFGTPNLYLKDESRNPSGTFKDRGASVAISRLRELGVKTVAISSSGNAGASWALYAARAEMRCISLLPNDVLPASLQQCAMAGALTFLFDGPWHEAGRLIEDGAQRHGWFNSNTLKEPYRVEGKKTMGYEICEQLGWELPDVIVYPTGGALGAIALFKAFDELRALGWVKGSRLPRLVVTQYEGCAPIVKAFKEGRERSELWENLDVLPGGLKSPRPPGDKTVLRILRKSGGTAVAVSSKQALENVDVMTRAEGIFPCPEAATVLSGLATGLAEGYIEHHDRIVLMNTGSGLKSIPNLPEPERVTIRTADDLAEAVSRRGSAGR
ncbi:MAG: threonine synthase [Acidiferrobacterales bacterium]|nr:threonine synthase [Acidiferrobacterales bacterium]